MFHEEHYVDCFRFVLIWKYFSLELSLEKAYYRILQYRLETKYLMAFIV